MSCAFQKGVYQVGVDDGGGTLKVGISGQNGACHLFSRSLALKIHGIAGAPHQVEVDRRELIVIDSRGSLEKLKEGAAANAKTRVVWINTPDQNFPLEAAIARQSEIGDMSPTIAPGLREESSPQILKRPHLR
jgi:hypothetical protein